MKDKLPIVVGGFYRSGTSLVRRILDSHTQIHCGPEVKFFKDFYGDYLRDPLKHVRFFSTAKTYHLNEKALLDIYGRAFVEFHVKAAEAAGKKRWADKNPENVLYLEQWHQLLPGNFIFIHIVRNPLDALASLSEIGFEKAVPTGFTDRVSLYKEFRHAGAEYCRNNPELSIEIAYEKLVSEPESLVRQLAEFVGERYEPEMLMKFNSVERGNGIEDPKVTLSKTIHTSSVDRGMRELSEPELGIASRVLGEFL